MPYRGRSSPDKFQYVQLKGGWDLLTPSLSLPGGFVRDSSNFEISTQGGYARISGYERFDGRPSPSSAAYSIVQVSSFVNVPSLGDQLDGDSSSASGIIVAVVQGAYNYMVLTKAVGAFTTSEDVLVGVTPIGTAIPQSFSITPLLNAQYLNLAADEYRSDIGAVPGSGPVRGVATLVVNGSDNTYAFRDNVGGTACDLYKATTSGWSQVTFPEEVNFTTGGASAPAEGATLTKGGVTATVRRILLESGSWASNTAAGRLILTNRAGGNFSSGAATLTGAINVTLAAAQSTITMNPGGKFEFVTANFFGRAGTIRLYGCDGANRAFEFDGTYFVPIDAGTGTAYPKYIAVHANHLFLGVQSSILHSGPNLPYAYVASLGASEIATGDNVTGFGNGPGEQATGSLVIYGTNRTSILYGTSVADWNFTQYKIGMGGANYTAQSLTHLYVLDDQGVVSLQTTNAFGHFAPSTLTANILPFIESQRSKVNTSVVCRAKSQYRIFFNDGVSLWTTIVNGKNLGSMKQEFPDIPFVCSNSDTLRANGNEEIFFGTTSNGYVMQMERGSSFDGAAIPAHFTLNWNALGTPRMRKRYRKATIETQGSFYAAFNFGYQLGYGSTLITQPSAVEYVSGFAAPPVWDSFIWGQFTWDGATVLPTTADLVGRGENLQMSITCGTDYIYPFTINSIYVDYEDGRTLR